MEIPLAYIKSLKADLVKKEVTITFTVALDEEMLERRERLAFMAFDGQPLRLEIMPRQAKLPFGATITRNPDSSEEEPRE